MIKLENIETYGWESAIRGMRNPMNSWDKSDSKLYSVAYDDGVYVGTNDLALMKSLVKAGSDHSKFMRMINVTMDITAPLYWWKEFDTYKVGTVRNSCSTMHKIHAKEFVIDDFSHEHLARFEEWILRNVTIRLLNHNRKRFIKTNNKKYWHKMIQLLPSSYNQKATVQLNYAVLRNMCHSRKNHKLDEWREFCEVIKTLPYSELITEEN